MGPDRFASERRRKTGGNVSRRGASKRCQPIDWFADQSYPDRFFPACDRRIALHPAVQGGIRAFGRSEGNAGGNWFEGAGGFFSQPRGEREFSGLFLRLAGKSCSVQPRRWRSSALMRSARAGGPACFTAPEKDSRGNDIFAGVVRRGGSRRGRRERHAGARARSPSRAIPRGFLFELLRAKHRPRRMPLETFLAVSSNQRSSGRSLKRGVEVPISVMSAMEGCRSVRGFSARRRKRHAGRGALPKESHLFFGINGGGREIIRGALQMIWRAV
jgi:hypothetical protein